MIIIICEAPQMSEQRAKRHRYLHLEGFFSLVVNCQLLWVFWLKE